MMVRWIYMPNQNGASLKISSQKIFLFYLQMTKSLLNLLKEKGSLAMIQQFSIQQTACLAFEKDGELHFNFSTNPITIAMNDLILKGNHNVYNSLAAGMAARALEVIIQVFARAWNVLMDYLTEWKGFCVLEVGVLSMTQSNECKFNMVCIRGHDF